MELLSREQLIEIVRIAVEGLDFVNAMWLGGSDAFGNADEYSDVDVQIDCADGRANAVFSAVENALDAATPITVRHILPQPTWHGHAQRFYRLKHASVHHVVDLVVLERNAGPRFNERELHGEPVVIFDKLGVIESVANDTDKLREELRNALKQHKLTAAITEGFVEKEVLRGNLLGALHWHYVFVVRFLQQVLRMRHTPHRYTFSLRYADMDLPREDCEELRRLLQVDGLEDVLAKHRVAQDRFWREAEALDIDRLEL